MQYYFWNLWRILNFFIKRVRYVIRFQSYLKKAWKLNSCRSKCFCLYAKEEGFFWQIFFTFSKNKLTAIGIKSLGWMVRKSQTRSGNSKHTTFFGLTGFGPHAAKTVKTGKRSAYSPNKRSKCEKKSSVCPNLLLNWLGNRKWIFRSVSKVGKKTLTVAIQKI